jgi:D-beta-D-heptose 7-phosphate kinase/D-beta-D-heptose 1-phosphate adenosyltransferase
MGFTGLSELLSEFPSRNILVVGDLMLDEYCRGHVERISPEAPVPILKAVSRELTLGGAANVVTNLCALGVSVSAVGVAGTDATGDQICGMLAELGTNPNGIVRESGRASTRKVRFVSLEHAQQVFRLDEETTSAVGGFAEERICQLVKEKASAAHAIICSDYRKGVLTERVLQAAFHEGQRNDVPVVVAPKDHDMRRYRGATVLMPNLREFQQISGEPLDNRERMEGAAARVMSALSLRAILITQGSHGMTLFEETANRLRRVDIPTVAKNVYDVTGAGDTAIAAFSAALAANAEYETGARIANIAAGIAVGKPGTASVSSAELQEHLCEQTLPKQEIYGPGPLLTSVPAGAQMAMWTARHR